MGLAFLKPSRHFVSACCGHSCSNSSRAQAMIHCALACRVVGLLVQLTDAGYRLQTTATDLSELHNFDDASFLHDLIRIPA